MSATTMRDCDRAQKRSVARGLLTVTLLSLCGTGYAARRGAFLQTSGSFTLNSGRGNRAGGRGNRAGNDEEHEALERKQQSELRESLGHSSIAGQDEVLSLESSRTSMELEPTSVTEIEVENHASREPGEDMESDSDAGSHTERSVIEADTTAADAKEVHPRDPRSKHLGEATEGGTASKAEVAAEEWLSLKGRHATSETRAFMAGFHAGKLSQNGAADPTAAPTSSPTAAPIAAPTTKAVNAAQCDASWRSNGGLPCPWAVNYKDDDMNNEHDPSKACPDDLSQGTFYNIQEDGTPWCVPFTEINALRGLAVSTNCDMFKNKPRSQFINDLNLNRAVKPPPYMFQEYNDTNFCDHNWKGLITKARIVPVGPSAAGIMLKRVAPCRKTANGQDAAKQCDVFKSALCLKCPASVKNPCKWEDPWTNLYTYEHTEKRGTEKSMKIGCFECPYNPKTCKNRTCRRMAPASGQWRGKGAKEYGCHPSKWFRVINEYWGLPLDGELKNFAQHCIQAEIKSGRVFDKDGNQAKEYMCGDNEQESFEVALKAF